MSISHITVLGGDLRQAYAAESLSSAGFHITCFKTPCFPYDSSINKVSSLCEALEHSPALLLPAPLSRDNIHLFETTKEAESLPLRELIGQLPEESVIFFSGMNIGFCKELQQKRCRLYNLSASSGFITQNARLTAEGLISELIRYTPFSLENTTILLLGYGHCGKAISTLLSAFTPAFMYGSRTARNRKKPNTTVY